MSIKSASDFDGATEGRDQEVPPVAPSPFETTARPARFTLTCEANPDNLKLIQEWFADRAKLRFVIEREHGEGRNLYRKDFVWAVGQVASVE